MLHSVHSIVYNTRQVDPLRLMYRLERLREEIPILQERAERLALAKREQLSECAGAFRESYGVLQHLLEVSGLPTDTDRENSGYTCSSDSSAKSCVEDIEKMLQMVSSHLDECLGTLLEMRMGEDSWGTMVHYMVPFLSKNLIQSFRFAIEECFDLLIDFHYLFSNLVCARQAMSSGLA